jgi:hypothetical protein
VPLNFSPLRSTKLVQEVGIALQLLGSTGAKMLKLEEDICDQLEVKDLAVSLDPVMLGLVAGTEEAASSGV